MFTQLRQDISARSQRLHQDVTRTRVQLRHARDEYHLARAERPRCVSRLADLVARYNGVTLYRDRVERGTEFHSLAGVRARVSESTTDAVHPSDGGAVRDVYLTISGPGWEWTVKTVAVFSSRRVHAFAALVNSHAAAATRTAVTRIEASHTAPVPATSTGQFRVLDALRGTGVLTDAEFAVATGRLGHRPSHTPKV